MFEQSLYDTEPVAAPTSEGDLFHSYEIRNWEFGPRIYKILAIAGAGNLLALLVFAQTSLLTMKGCDSPLVGRVCEALDVVYVGAMVFGTDRDYVDKAYERTELGDADITFVDVSGTTPPLSYPEGYFQLANPEEFAMIQQQANDPMFNGGGFPPGLPYTPPATSGNSLLDTKPNVPKKNDDVIDGDLPSFNSGSTTGTTTKPRTPRQPKATPTPKSDDATAGNDPKVDPTKEDAQEDKFGVYINKRPLKDRAKDTVEKINANEVKLDSKFKVTVSGMLGLGKDGKTVVLKNPKPVPEPGVKNDPKIEKLVQEWILAVGDAGWFGYLEKLDEQKKIKSKKVVITIEQNDSDFFAVLKAEQPDENMAKTAASGLNTILSLAAPATSGDEQIFLKAAKSTFDGRVLVLNFHIPKPQVQEMIQRKLAEQKAEPQQKNGNAVGGLGSNTAALK